MKIFGKDREHLRIQKIKASRAVMVMARENIVECNITMITEDGEKLDLTIPDRLLPHLIQSLTITYEAIHPPLRSGNRQALWNGMDNG